MIFVSSSYTQIPLLSDFNNDGFQDLCLFNDIGLSFQFAIFQNDGANNFVETQKIGSYERPNAIGIPHAKIFSANLSAVDYNGDGFTDVIFTYAFKTPKKIICLINQSFLSNSEDASIASLSVVFPNPSGDYLEIISKNPLKSYRIYNLEGNRVLDGKFDSFIIDLKDLSPQMYILETTDINNKLEVIRFIKGS